MPRHLERALEQLEVLPTDAFPPGWGGPHDAEPDLEVVQLFNYMNSASGWYYAGLKVESEALLRRAVRLWKSRPELHPVLRPWIIHTPCDPFSGLVTRMFKQRWFALG
ncbi:MAG: hypothetical protein AAFX99_31715, partial [Myxococcota bacterium]